MASSGRAETRHELASPLGAEGRRAHELGGEEPPRAAPMHKPPAASAAGGHLRAAVPAGAASAPDGTEGHTEQSHQGPRAARDRGCRLCSEPGRSAKRVTCGAQASVSAPAPRLPALVPGLRLRLPRRKGSCSSHEDADQAHRTKVSNGLEKQRNLYGVLVLPGTVNRSFTLTLLFRPYFPLSRNGHSHLHDVGEKNSRFKNIAK